MKNAVTLKNGLGVRQGHCNVGSAMKRIRLHIDDPVVNMALRRIVFDIINVCRDL